jgi:hypothetical protein
MNNLLTSESVRSLTRFSFEIIKIAYLFQVLGIFPVDHKTFEGAVLSLVFILKELVWNDGISSSS